jgi:hypothetical protein
VHPWLALGGAVAISAVAGGRLGLAIYRATGDRTLAWRLGRERSGLIFSFLFAISLLSVAVLMCVLFTGT